MQLLGDSSKFHIAGTGLHCPWLPSAPLGAGVMIISCGSHSPPILAESALKSLPPSSIPGYKIIVIIFRGGKTLSAYCFFSGLCQVFAFLSGALTVFLPSAGTVCPNWDPCFKNMARQRMWFLLSTCFSFHGFFLGMVGSFILCFWCIEPPTLIPYPILHPHLSTCLRPKAFFLNCRFWSLNWSLDTLAYFSLCLVWISWQISVCLCLCFSQCFACAQF